MCTLDEPKLPISYRVKGRRTRPDKRVEYLVDPRGIDKLKYAIPEEIVLKRWRRRQALNYDYGGARLSPNIWRSIKEALGEDANSINELSISDIDQKYASAKIRLDALNYKMVCGENIRKLVFGLGIKKFQRLLDRHNREDRKDIYGTPDLILWTLTPRRRKISEVKFVEVKKPNEPLSQDQKDEINFLREILNVSTILVRLKEV